MGKKVQTRIVWCLTKTVAAGMFVVEAPIAQPAIMILSSMRLMRAVAAIKAQNFASKLQATIVTTTTSSYPGAKSI